LRIAQKEVQMLSKFVVGLFFTRANVYDIKERMSLHKTLEKCREFLGSTESLQSG
jgi:hypothetical protein